MPRVPRNHQKTEEAIKLPLQGPSLIRPIPRAQEGLQICVHIIISFCKNFKMVFSPQSIKSTIFFLSDFALGQVTLSWPELSGMLLRGCKLGDTLSLV